LTPIQTPHVADVSRNEEIAMFALTEISRTTQRFACMMMAVVIVAAGLSAGALKAQSLEHVGYSVTITQLQ
jgi:hypothetical protein